MKKRDIERMIIKSADSVEIPEMFENITTPVEKEEKPRRRLITWRRCVAMACAVALVCGVVYVGGGDIFDMPNNIPGKVPNTTPTYLDEAKDPSHSYVEEPTVSGTTMPEPKPMVPGDMVIGESATSSVMPGVTIPDKDIWDVPDRNEQIVAGTLTAGEWNDNLDFDFFKTILNNNDWYAIQESWGIYPTNRMAVSVTIDTGVARGIKVYLKDSNGDVIWTAVTDHHGKAYLFYNLKKDGQTPSAIEVEGQKFEARDGLVVNLSSSNISNIVDLMFVIDTTGSMYDEIEYLKTELLNVINRVKDENKNAVIRLSVNFYRDEGDVYVLRSNDFTTDVEAMLQKLQQETANGGGDYPEAVHKALDDAINNHSWSENSVKLCFFVLDAPPHIEQKDTLLPSIEKASEMGIRIIPVASSGVDTQTEFLLRTFSALTGGTYTFLTNHSGVGGDHLEPTIGEYEVYKLNDLLVKIISDYVTGK